jgi:hypothetical protein
MRRDSPSGLVHSANRTGSNVDQRRGAELFWSDATCRMGSDRTVTSKPESPKLSRRKIIFKENG